MNECSYEPLFAVVFSFLSFCMICIYLIQSVTKHNGTVVHDIIQFQRLMTGSQLQKHWQNHVECTVKE